MSGASGIASVSAYVPGASLDATLAVSLGVPTSMRLAAPDEDSLTMAWEVLRRLDTPVEERAHLLLAGDFEGLEPRAVAAHLAATGCVREDVSVTTLHCQIDLAELLDLGCRSRAGTVAVIVDRTRGSKSLEAPLGDCAVALAFGHPDIATVSGYTSQSALSFDRWQESDERADRDARFVEERLVAREAADVVSALRKQHSRGDASFAGAVVTAGVRLKEARLASHWDVPRVWVPVPAATEPGAGNAQVMAATLRLLAAQGSGTSLALVNLGWGASGVVITAADDIGSVASVSADPGAAYDTREWLAVNRPPYTASPWTSAAELSREARDLLAMVGGSCTSCGASFFPHAKVCEQCAGLDVTATPLQRVGTVITHSIDELYGAPDTTVQMVVVALDGGGQFYGQAVARLPQWFQIADRCRLSLRRMHTAGGLPHYYWKVDTHVS